MYFFNISQNITILIILLNSKLSNALFNKSNDVFDAIINKITTSIVKNLPFFDYDMFLNPFDTIERYKAVLNNEEIFMEFPELVNHHGYKAEKHEVTTDDGYILTMFRIPRDGPVVFLMHGAQLNCDSYVTIGPDRGLAYLLADAGYDVWLGNARGTKYSLKHDILPPDSAAFWDFGFDEIGRYDLPAMIDYSLMNANKTKLSLIGHSQGSTLLLVLLSERPEYNDRVSVAIHLSATSWLSHTRTPWLRLSTAPIFPYLFKILRLIGIHSVLKRTPFLTALTTVFCGTPDLAFDYCNNLLFAFVGMDYYQVDKSRLPVIFGHFPDVASIHQAMHFAQLVKSGKFRRFDYGKPKNLLIYGSLEPPDYPIEKIKTSTAIFFSENDWVCDEADLLILLERLPNAVGLYKVPFKQFSHVDYLFAKDVKQLLYNEVMRVIKLSNSKK